MAMYLKAKNCKNSHELSCVVQQIKYINYLMPDLDEYISESCLVGMNVHSNCRRYFMLSLVVNYNPLFVIARPKRRILSWLCRSIQCYNKIITVL